MKKVLDWQKAHLGGRPSLVLTGTSLTFHWPPCSSYAWFGLGEIEELPGSCGERHVGQWGALLWVVRIKAIGIVHLGRISLGVSLGGWPSYPSLAPILQLDRENITTIQPHPLLSVVQIFQAHYNHWAFAHPVSSAWNRLLPALHTFQVSAQISLPPQGLSSPLELKCPPPHSSFSFFCAHIGIYNDSFCSFSSPECHCELHEGKDSNFLCLQCIAQRLAHGRYSVNICGPNEPMEGD